MHIPVPKEYLSQELEVTIVKTDEDMNTAHKRTGNFIGILDGKIGNRDEKGHLA